MKSAVGAAQITGIDPQIASIVPRRIILSRKGWDSKAGGWPNPILPGGHPLSLPIPDSNSGVTYGDLYLPDGRKLVGEMVRQLSNGKWGPDDELHLDPDIRQNAVKRKEFRAAFGQCGESETHLHEAEGVLGTKRRKQRSLSVFWTLPRSRRTERAMALPPTWPRNSIDLRLVADKRNDFISRWASRVGTIAPPLPTLWNCSG